MEKKLLKIVAKPNKEGQFHITFKNKKCTVRDILLVLESVKEHILLEAYGEVTEEEKNV